MCVCACMRVCVRPCVCHNSTIARYTLQVAAKLPAVVRRAGGAATTHRQTDLMIQSSVSCVYVIVSPHCMTIHFMVCFLITRVYPKYSLACDKCQRSLELEENKHHG